MRILIVSPTKFELQRLADDPEIDHLPHEIIFQISGVGCMVTTFQVNQYIMQTKPNLVLMGGIAGAYNPSLAIGDVICVSSDTQVTTGVEENGIWKDIFDMGFADKYAFPFKNGRLENAYLNEWNKTKLPSAIGVSVDEITSNKNRSEQYQYKYQAAVESMEGAGFHYVSLQNQIPFLQIRSISNYVGIRDKSQWNISLALQNLHKELLHLLKTL